MGAPLKAKPQGVCGQRRFNRAFSAIRLRRSFSGRGEAALHNRVTNYTITAFRGGVGAKRGGVHPSRRKTAGRGYAP